jgi:hypothetical protein
MELAEPLIAMQMAATRHSAQIAVIKKQHDMQTELLTMLMDTAKAPPPPGQGLRVDRTA